MHKKKKAKDLIKKLNELSKGENNKWTKVYFFALINGKIEADNLRNDKTLTDKGIFPEWKSRKTWEKFAKSFLEEMRKERFLKKVDDYYKPNKDIIKSIVKYFAFSDNEARILEKLLCNSAKQSQYNYKNRIKYISSPFPIPSEPREKWQHDLEKQIRSKKRVNFMGMFPMPEPSNNTTYLKYISPNYNCFLKYQFQYKNSLSTLIRYIIGVRIDETKDLKNYPDDQGFEIKRIIFFDNIFTHLMLYPYMKQNNFVIPNVIEENNHSFVQFDFKDFDIIETWKIMIKYITKYKHNHFAFDFIGDWLKEKKNQVGLPKYSMKTLIDDKIILLAKNKYLIICNYPFTIKISGNKTLLIKKLEELREYIIKNKKI